MVDRAQDGSAAAGLRSGHFPLLVGVTQQDVHVMAVGVEHSQVQNGDAMNLHARMETSSGCESNCVRYQ